MTYVCPMCEVLIHCIITYCMNEMCTQCVRLMSKRSCLKRTVWRAPLYLTCSPDEWPPTLVPTRMLFFTSCQDAGGQLGTGLEFFLHEHLSIYTHEQTTPKTHDLDIDSQPFQRNKDSDEYSRENNHFFRNK